MKAIALQEEPEFFGTYSEGEQWQYGQDYILEYNPEDEDQWQEKPLLCHMPRKRPEYYRNLPPSHTNRI
jgi:hypothetical protein